MNISLRANPRDGRHGRRFGFTLVELLTVLAVIGVLVALMLPALGTAMESGRRVTCRNHLRSIAAGLTAYHVPHDSFPPGGVEWRPNGDTTKRQLAWSAFLLPHIDEQPVYAGLDLSKAFDAPENAAAAATVIPTYVCPSGVRGMETVAGRGPCDYGGIYGERISGPNRPPKGTMIYDVPIADRDIVDGLSQTLIVAEDSGWPDGQWINGRNIFDQAFAINAAPDFENDIRSTHGGGANAALAGGAVRFLHEGLDMETLAAICTRAEREVVDDF